MKLYIVLYHHRHGTDAWPLWVFDGEKPPTLAEIAAGLPDWEPDRDEWLELNGPFEIPTPRAVLEDRS